MTEKFSRIQIMQRKKEMESKCCRFRLGLCWGGDKEKKGEAGEPRPFQGFTTLCGLCQMDTGDWSCSLWEGVSPLQLCYSLFRTGVRQPKVPPPPLHHTPAGCGEKEKRSLLWVTWRLCIVTCEKTLSAFLGQKQSFLDKKCTIRWYVFHIILS